MDSELSVLIRLLERIESAILMASKPSTSSTIISQSTDENIPDTLESDISSVSVVNTPSINIANTPNVSIVGTVSIGGTVSASQSGTWTVQCNIEENPTYLAVFDRIAPAANKYLATLWNGASGRKVCIRRITVWNWQESAVSGTVIAGELRRITGHTAGTSVTPVAMDTDDTLASGITADTDSSSVTDDVLLSRFVASGEEFALGSDIYQNLLAINGSVVYEHLAGTKPLTLHTDQGITLKQITSTTAGTVSIVIMFTDESS